MNTGVIIMLSNYTHDLATGLMFGSVLAYMIALRVMRGGLSPAQALQLHHDLYRSFKPVVFWTLLAVLGLGVPRMIFYEQYEWSEAAGRGQIAALIVKHIALVGVTVTSLGYFFRSGPKPGEGSS